MAQDKVEGADEAMCMVENSGRNLEYKVWRRVLATTGAGLPLWAVPI